MKTIILFMAIMSLSLSMIAQGTFVPSTTLQVETANNTSTSDTFAGFPNGNPPPGNISKLPLRSLLYPGATTKVYTHFMPWFGKTSHVQVGYQSNDPAQVSRQVNDMISRGIDGLVIDWYTARSTYNETVSKLVRDEVGRHPGFNFLLCYDGFALKDAADPTAQLIADLNYAYTNYYSSPAYTRVNGRPLVHFFSVEVYPIDWTKVRAGVKGNPIFIFRNAGAFAKSFSDGGFGWIGVSTTAGMGYLNDFYYNANKYPNKVVFGGVYKGFNDSIASWGSNRLAPQNCASTWLNTWATANLKFSSTNQLDFIMLNTWNDYEEGTALEMGVDNCVSLAGSVNGSVFSATVTGNPATIDHYTAFISTDGQNLAVLADGLSTPSLDLDTFTVPTGTYSLFMKAVGKPGIFNHMSPAFVWKTVYNRPVVSLVAQGQDPNSSPVHVQAAAAAGTKPVSTMALYVDGVQVYKLAGDQLDRWICLPTGTHLIGVNAWDTRGVSGVSTMSVNVL
jgi:hypothetical protein